MTEKIPLTRGYIALVDDKDYPWLKRWKWTAFPSKTGNTYAFRRIAPRRGRKAQTVLMHRVIMDAPGGMQVDHINGNGLDNQRGNLRLVTRQQNLQNRPRFKNNKSGYKGVMFNKQTGKWRMSVHFDYDTPEEAARAYDRIALLCYGEFARTNFPVGLHKAI